MNIELYEQFLYLERLNADLGKTVARRSGKMAKATAVLASFIASFETLEEKQDWVNSILESGENGYELMRYEIYNHVFYPVLLDGYLKGEVKSVALLARTALSLYKVKEIHPALKDKSDVALLHELYELDPSEKNRKDLLKRKIQWCYFSEHEWPKGILDGMNFAGLDDYEGLLQLVEFTRSLDHEGEYSEYLSEYEEKVHEHMNRLQERKITNHDKNL